MADQTQSWAEQTVEVPPQSEVFPRGVASVTPPTAPFSTAPVPPTNWPTASDPGVTGWPGDPSRRLPMSYHLRQLRIGMMWSLMGALFAFVCWGIWAISTQGDFTSPILTFVLTLLVGVGLFALSRLLGRMVLERQFGRVRRSARGAHGVTALFLVGAGVAYLRQTEWVMGVWNWFAGLW